MKRAIAIVSIFLLSACKAAVWDKPGATQYEFDSDIARCRMAMAGTPMPYQVNNSAPGDVGGAMKGLGATIGGIADQRMYLNNCMQAQGWRQVQ